MTVTVIATGKDRKETDTIRNHGIRTGPFLMDQNHGTHLTLGPLSVLSRGVHPGTLCAFISSVLKRSRPGTLREQKRELRSQEGRPPGVPSPGRCPAPRSISLSQAPAPGLRRRAGREGLNR